MLGKTADNITFIGKQSSNFYDKFIKNYINMNSGLKFLPMSLYFGGILHMAAIYTLLSFARISSTAV